jgi:hypothetical protein
MVEIYFNAQSDNGTLTAGMRLKGPWVILEFSIVANVTRDHALRRWSQLYLNSMQPAKDPRAAMHLQNWMIEAGFEQVEARMLTLPLSGWPTGESAQVLLWCSGTRLRRSLLTQL